MIFQPAQLAAIRSRRKTQLRLPADSIPRCPFTPGRLYRARSVNAGWTAAELADHRDWAHDEAPTRARAVLAYLDEPVDHAFTAPSPMDVTVLETHLAELGSVDQQAAQREGFRFLTQFQAWWRSEHGEWDPARPVWVVTFAVGDFRDQFDVPRLLKATPGTVSGKPDETEEHQDYTTRPALAMAGEPEAVSVHDQKRISDRARRSDDVRRRTKNAEMPRTARIAALERAAAAGDQHAKRHLHVIDQRIQAAERKHSRDAA